MSMSTKLGTGFCATMLYAPVAEPGLMSRAPPTLSACGRAVHQGAQSPSVRTGTAPGVSTSYSVMSPQHGARASAALKANACFLQGRRCDVNYARDVPCLVFMRVAGDKDVHI